MRKIKIKNMDDFAKVCGVSRPTISKFFYDPNSIRKSIKNKGKKNFIRGEKINLNYNKENLHLFNEVGEKI